MRELLLRAPWQAGRNPAAEWGQGAGRTRGVAGGVPNSPGTAELCPSLELPMKCV